MGYTLFIDNLTEAASSYRGKAEVCLYTFRSPPEQVPFEQQLAQMIIDNHIRELNSQGSRLLKLRAWRDVEPTFWTDYKLEVTATASPLWWNAVIIGVLGVIGLAILTWAIVEVKEIDWGGVPAPIPWAILTFGILGIILLTRRWK